MMKVPTREEFEYAYEMARIIIKTDFFNYDSMYNWEGDYADMLADHYGITVESGCTKACFLSTDSDWVIKVNLGCVSDYCYNEARNYQYAIMEGVEEAFAACYFLDRIDGHDFYIEEMVCVDEITSDSTCYDYASRLAETENQDDINEIYYDLDDSERVYALFENMDIRNKLLGFICDYGINDLHVGNFGYRGDSPVIIDYSGF